MPAQKVLLENREISWLSFNARVLQEADDPTVPLIERLRFLGIFSSNLDEFFRIRVATVRRLVDLREQSGRMDPVYAHPARTLAQIQSVVIRQQRRFEAIYKGIVRELREHGIQFCNEKELDAETGAAVRAYFSSHVLPTLVPVMLGNPPALPALKDHSIYLLVRMSRSGGQGKDQHALIEVPTEVVSRFLLLPAQSGRQVLMLLDDVIRYCLPDIFYMFEYDRFQAWTIKVTRDADLTLDQSVQEDLPQRIAKSLKLRKRGRPVRLVYDHRLPAALRKALIRSLRFSRNDLVIPGARYHNFKDFIAFPKVAGRGLHYPALRVTRHADLPAQVSVLAIIERGDRLLHYPYQSFDAMIRFLREAAIDPEVTAIKTTLYRAAKESRVVNALINAVKNGKAVTVVVELQARFNEEDNLHLADRLAEEGARVIYSPAGLKIHCKVTLVERQRGGKVLRYCNLATGNYNEQTAQAYCDDSLFTSDPRLTTDVARLFRSLEGTLKDARYTHLLVAPQFLRKGLTALIEQEMRNAKHGRPAFITLKMNNLSDPGMIAQLYRASQAGVAVRLIVRGICCLVPGVRHLSSQVKAISIVDRFLEHSRIFVFGNGGRPRVFLSSADLMTRNLDFRVEAVWPIYDAALRQELMDMLDIQWRDNVKARVISRSQTNGYRHRHKDRPVRSQQAIRSYLESKSLLPARIRPAPAKPARVKPTLAAKGKP